MSIFINDSESSPQYKPIGMIGGKKEKRSSNTESFDQKMKDSDDIIIHSVPRIEISAHKQQIINNLNVSIKMN